MLERSEAIPGGKVIDDEEQLSSAQLRFQRKLSAKPSI
jgi:hypothetical protein